jgi:hypothetical protein
VPYLNPTYLPAENNSVMFCVGNFANLTIFTSILEEDAHIWMFTYQPPSVGRSQREGEIEYVTRR